MVKLDLQPAGPEILDIRPVFEPFDVNVADPDDIRLGVEKSLEIADDLEIPISHAEEISDTLGQEKYERPGLIMRGLKNFVNTAFVQPFKNIQKYSTLGELDTQMEALSELRRIKEQEGREVDPDEIPQIFEKAKATVDKRIQGQLPQLELPPAKGIVEKGVEIASGVLAFVAKLAVARRFVGTGGAGAEIVSFEMVNLADNGTPGMGILLASSLGLVGKVPTATAIGKVGKTAAQGGVLASVTAMEGGSKEDIAVAFFLPAVLRTINEFPHLVKGKAFERVIAKEVKAQGFADADAKAVAKSVRDAVEVKNGTMSPNQWGQKHGKPLNDIRAKYNKAVTSLDTQTRAIQEAKTQPAKPAKTPPKVPAAKPEGYITPEEALERKIINKSQYEKIKHGGLTEKQHKRMIDLARAENERTAKPAEAKQPAKKKVTTDKPAILMQGDNLDTFLNTATKGQIANAVQRADRTYQELRRTHKSVFDALPPVQDLYKEAPEGTQLYSAEHLRMLIGGLRNAVDIIDKMGEIVPEELKLLQPVVEALAKGEGETAESMIRLFNEHTTEQKGLERGLDYYRDKLKTLSDEELGKLLNWTRQPERTGFIGRFVRDDVAAIMRSRGLRPERTIADAIEAEQIAKLPLFKKQPTIKKVQAQKQEERDILGGVDPLQRIHSSLREAKKVQPITEAQKKETLKKRVGAAAGAMKSNVKKGVPTEEAIFKSTGLLKGELAEYDRVYESIEDALEPGQKEAAYQQIYNHPDLKYFEIVNTATSFKKLLAGTALTPGDVKNIERVFGKQFKEITDERTTVSDLYDRLVSLWKAGLLTGIKTSGLNEMANISHAMTETAKDIPAALVDSMASVLTGQRTIGLTLRGVTSGTIEGIQKGWKYLRTGVDSRNVGQKLDYKEVNFGKSKFARALQAYEETIFHLLGAEDQPFYYGAKARSLYSQAIAKAKNKGLKGEERTAFIDNLVKNPTDDMLEWAVYDAEVAVFQNRTYFGDIAKDIQKSHIGEIIVPFGRTPAAVATQIINYSPAGVVKEIFDEVHKKQFNQRKFSQAFGRSALGTAPLALGALLFKVGLLALDRPDNERERELWKAEGRSANSIKIDNEWRSVQVLGPAGNLILIGGHFQKQLDETGSPTEAIATAMAGGAKSFSEQTFVRGVNMAVDALTDPEKSFENWWASMAGSLVPTIVADIARAQDEIERRAITPAEKVQKRIPVLREKLPPAIDVLGQDLPRYGGNVLETMADPSRPSKIRQDVVVDELRRLWDKNIKVSPTQLGDKAGYDILSSEENTQLWRRSGELTYKLLVALVTSEGYQGADDFLKGRQIEAITRKAKSAAKAEMVNIKIGQGRTIMELAESGLLNLESLEMLKYYREQE